MATAIGDVLVPGIGIAISPLALVATVLMLATPRGRANGITFTVSWVLSLAVVGAILLVIGQSSGDTDAEPPDWPYYVKLLLGVLFLVMSGVQWHGRPRAGEPETPGWMARLDRITPGGAAGLAAVMAVLNPKNLALLAGGVMAVATSGAGTGGQWIAVLVLVVISSLCAVIPLTAYLCGGPKAAGMVDSWKTWMITHNNAIMVVLLLVLGTKYVGEALKGLVA